MILAKFDSFLQRAILAHKNEYDYSLVNYVHDNVKVNIVCKIHGTFLQSPNKHICKKQGCPKCYKTPKLTIQTFIEKAIKTHGNKYDYSLVKEINGNETTLEIICKKHEVFKQSARAHLFGNGCPFCGGSKILDLDKFIEKSNKIHNNKYDYSLSEYKNNKSKIMIICKIHGSFLQNAKNHMNGSGCPNCKQPKNEQRTGVYLKEILPTITIHPHKKFESKGLNCSEKIIVDYYFELNNQKYIIEYNGIQHYQPIRFGKINKETSEEVFAYQQKRDLFLRDMCQTRDINLIEIDGRKIFGTRIKQFLEKILLTAISINSS